MASSSNTPMQPAPDMDLLRSVTEFLPVGIFTTDTQGNCTFVNPKYCEITGQCIGPELAQSGCHFQTSAQCAQTRACSHSVAGTGWRHAVHPDDRAAVVEQWERLLEQGEGFTMEYRIQRPDAQVVWVQVQAQRQQDANGVAWGCVCSMTDISERKRTEQEIQQLAFYDALTGLPNRRLLEERIKLAVANSVRTGNHGALLYLDLDNFKLVNDTKGHAVGDELLKQVAQRLKSGVREGDLVARLGGDEFLLVIEGLGKDAEDAGMQAEAVAYKLLDSLNRPYLLDGSEQTNSPSIGVTLFGQTRVGLDDLLRCADMAMYRAKASGRNSVQFYDPQLQAVLEARLQLESDLRHAVHHQAFELHYQPQFDAQHRVTGAVAYVRWNCPQRGWVSPASFIPLAEETGLIAPIGHWVLERACQQLALWGRQPATAALTVAVKISAQQFRLPDFVQTVLHTLQATQANPERLKLEINENLLLVNVEDIIAKTNLLIDQGVGCTLADLGTGYSSLSHLKRLSLEELRIDQSFVRGLLTEPNDTAVTRSIMALADSLGIGVSAEGVETHAQHELLTALGCQGFQGYLYGKPLPIDAFEAFLVSGAAAT